MSSIKVNNVTVLIPDKSSPCDLWLGYYKQLDSLFGNSNAKRIWLLTWSKNGANSCTRSPEFNKWLKQKGIDVSDITSKTIADLKEFRSNIFGLGKGLTKVLAYGIPILLVVIMLAIVMAIYNTSKNTNVGDLAALTPVGRAAQLAKGLKG